MDVKVTSVTKVSTENFKHGTGDSFTVTTYDVRYTIGDKKFNVLLQKSIKNGHKQDPYLHTAQLEAAIHTYYGEQLAKGEKRNKQRQALADKIVKLALKKMGG